MASKTPLVEWAPLLVEPERCEIQWIGPDGKPTPDSNPAVGYVQREAYTLQDAHAVHGCVHFSATRWYAVCEQHRAQLSEPGMEHWHFRPR